MKNYEFKECNCPVCNKALDRASAMQGADTEPSPSDITLCIGCGAILCFSSEMNLVKLREDDFNVLPYATKISILKLQYLITKDLPDPQNN